jgi:16S rRNA U516 pseudouridylate synthase RsuA-like enzyme
MPLGGWTSCLPRATRHPPKDTSYAVDVKLEDMPTQLDCTLVEAVAAALQTSKGKARKFIARGEARVNGEVVRDPDVRVKRSDRVELGREGLPRRL